MFIHDISCGVFVDGIASISFIVIIIVSQGAKVACQSQRSRSACFVYAAICFPFAQSLVTARARKGSTLKL